MSNFHNRARVLSYKAALSFVNIKRGIGKSFSYSCLALDDYIRKKKKTLWVRRYKDEIKMTKESFFDDLPKVYKKHNLAVKGNFGLIDDEPFIRFLPLTQAAAAKSKSFGQYDLMIFDEFIPENPKVNRYLPNECASFASLLSTVFRHRPMRCICLGNKTSEVTPYNLYFNVCNFDRTRYYPERKILVYCDEGNGEIANIYKNSDLEKVLRGTSYYGFALKNESLTDTKDFIRPIPDGAKELFVVNIEGIDIGFYLISQESALIASLKCSSTNKMRYVVSSDNLKASYLLLSRRSPFYKYLHDCVEYGMLYYDTLRTKAICSLLVDKIK